MGFEELFMILPQWEFSLTCTPVSRGLDMGKPQGLKSTFDAPERFKSIKVIKWLGQFCEVTQHTVNCCPEGPGEVPPQLRPSARFPG